MRQSCHCAEHGVTDIRQKTASNDTAGSFTVGLKECCDCVALPQIALNWVASQANSCLIFHRAELWDLCLHESVSVFVYHTVKEVAEFGVSHKIKPTDESVVMFTQPHAGPRLSENAAPCLKSALCDGRLLSPHSNVTYKQLHPFDFLFYKQRHPSTNPAVKITNMFNLVRLIPSKTGVLKHCGEDRCCKLWFRSAFTKQRALAASISFTFGREHDRNLTRR